ncbi:MULTISPECIES: peptidase U32 family protein [unclassified Wenzhouxiangella]|uniref:ubiquinone anaerobic biosynthesis protein UbiU n=1 Tax=unclassified Wenzhouxiangella TaxID=2613841 RepID=UPI000E32CD33|nr:MULTISPECIES: peptidase U32 family protein [unclassified Wenzhouxiangella]RFF27468.1 U32 family peptidase [Wenzhouxiangella sp. 15181]RFP68898.1 U32 family peptidase [Wenzhouxiangella sp. 15190]
MKLVCPAGSLPALTEAVNNGTDAVYLGFRDATNARAFPGLNFSDRDIDKALTHARSRGCQVYVALNTYPTSDRLSQWYSAVDRAADLGVDALIIAEMAVMDYAARKHPGIRRHLSVQGSATTAAALKFFHEQFGISRAVLPRVLAIQQVEQLARKTPVELEVFAFGSLCIMVEGRCQLSSYVTGKSPNLAGVCSPAEFVAWEDTPEGKTARLNGVLIDRFSDDEPAGYPVLCKGRYQVSDEIVHALEEPTSLNTLELLPRLKAAGISAVKIEGRQRSPAYVGTVARIWREAIDRLEADPEAFATEPEWQSELTRLSEGSQVTLGPYQRAWQ